VKRRRLNIPESVYTFYHGRLSIWGGTALKLEKFLQFAYCQRLGQFNCKRLRGGDIALIYDIQVHWRSKVLKGHQPSQDRRCFYVLPLQP
jgi:hypothetical protein